MLRLAFFLSLLSFCYVNSEFLDSSALLCRKADEANLKDSKKQGAPFFRGPSGKKGERGMRGENGDAKGVNLSSLRGDS